MSAAGPPPGLITPEYLAADKSRQVVEIIIAFPCVALVIVSLRLYTRTVIVKAPSWDDLCIALAFIFSVATSVCQGFQVINGMGKHKWALTPENAIGSLKALFASIMMYNFGLTLTKISIVLQYLRIALDKKVRQSCWGLFWFTIANCIQTFVTGILSCYPVPKFWDDSIEGGCVNKPALWYANAAINIIQDIWLIVIPIFIIRKLLIPKREKVSLCLILGLGGFASCASVFRLHALYLVAISDDITWDNTGSATWSAMELNVGIICASLPTLRALFAIWFPNFFKAGIISRNRPGNGYLYDHELSGEKKRKITVGSGRRGDDMEDTLVNGTILVKNEVEVDVESGRGSRGETRDETWLDSDADEHSQKGLRRPPIASMR